MQLPPGVNLGDDLGPSVNAIVSVFSVLATVSVALRLLSRHLQKVSWALSDWLILVGLFFAWALSIGLYTGASRRCGSIGHAFFEPSADKR